MYIVFFSFEYIYTFEGYFIEYVCWWEFICELLETIFSLYPLCYILLSVRDECLSLRDSRSLSSPSSHPLMMWLFSMFWFELIIISFVCSLFHYHPHYYFRSISFVSPTCSSLTHLTTSSIFFIFSLSPLHSHWTPSSPLFMRFSIHMHFYTQGYGFDQWVYESSFSSFLLHYYPSLCFALRPPWGHEIRCHLW